jgi:hypothetical protein
MTGGKAGMTGEEEEMTDGRTVTVVEREYELCSHCLYTAEK